MCGGGVEKNVRKDSSVRALNQSHHCSASRFQNMGKEKNNFKLGCVSIRRKSQTDSRYNSELSKRSSLNS